MASPSSRLDAQLAALPSGVLAAFERQGFDRAKFVALAERLASGAPEDNLVKGSLSAPEPEELTPLPASGPERERLEEVGKLALREGQVALVVLAGGMATRMGGVVKALVEALPGKTFLDLRLREIDALERLYGVAPPLWLMTSHSTDDAIRGALGAHLDGERPLSR